MSWYSIIYVYVRNFRERRPFLGLFLHLSLNSLLLIQLIGTVFSYYVYTYVVCMKMLTSTVQKCIYLSVYNSMFFMFAWSLFKTMWTPVTRVPDEYKADSTFDQRIKAVTPYENGRFVPDKSNKQQIRDQKALLNELVQQKGLDFVETDNYGRYRYCYQCCHLKPDRSHHCSSCGKCVVKFDHHCPLINKCISHRNYKFFLLYLSYMCLILAWSFFTSIEAFARYFVNKKWIDGLGDVIQVTICLAMHGAFGCYPLGDLLIYHFKLIAINETTCEQAKEPIIREDENADYNFGCYQNYRSVFGWGLWLFPIDTAIQDGMHFPVRYSPECPHIERREVREITATDFTLTRQSNTFTST